MSLAEEIAVPEWTFGDRLRKARLRAGLEQDELAKMLGVTRASLSSWEKDRTRPRDLLTTANEWALYTRVPVAWILTGTSWEMESPASGGSSRYVQLRLDPVSALR